MDVSRYVKIDFSLFETAITDIGGVVVDMSQAEADYMNGLAGEQKWTAGTAAAGWPHRVGVCAHAQAGQRLGACGAPA